MNVDERLAGLFVAERDAFVMLASSDYLMAPYRWRVSGNEFSTAEVLRSAVEESHIPV